MKKFDQNFKLGVPDASCITRLRVRGAALGEVTPQKPPRGVNFNCGDSPRCRLPEENARGGSPPARTTFSNGYASCMVRFCVCCTMIQTNIRIYCSKHARYCRITMHKNARYFFMLGYSADSYFNDARFSRFFAENHAKRLTVHAIFRIIKMKTGCRFCTGRLPEIS